MRRAGNNGRHSLPLGWKRRGSGGRGHGCPRNTGMAPLFFDAGLQLLDRHEGTELSELLLEETELRLESVETRFEFSGHERSFGTRAERTVEVRFRASVDITDTPWRSRTAQGASR